MNKTFARWLEEKNSLLLLGFLIITLVSIASPQAARATGTHDGKFSVSANKRTTIYNNATAVTQTVLVTVCVTTSGTTQFVVIEDRLSDGSTTDALVNVGFGTCRSLTVDLLADHVIAVRAPTSFSAAGTYTVSVQVVNPPPGP